MWEVYATNVLRAARAAHWAMRADGVPARFPRSPAMFEDLRRSLQDLLSRATPPEERRSALARMRETLVQARMGLDDLREGLARTRARVEAERRELETVRRRKALAARIDDQETVAVAERFEALQAERLAVLERKASVQEAELALAEREVTAMTAEFKQAALGAPPGAAASSVTGGRAVPDPLDAPIQELDALERARRRAEREAAAEDQLAALKRRMGK